MTSAHVQEGPVILIGYEYRLQLEAETDLFPGDATFTGQVRRKVADTEILATLSSTNGGVVRRDAWTLEIVLSPDLTAGLSPGRVVLDLVRTDVEPDRHLGVLLDIPVALPVTRYPLAARPDLTIDELTAELAAKHGVKVHRSSVGRLLLRLGLSHKKRPSSA